MKRVLLLIALLGFSSGCSTYTSANYQVNLAGEIQATGNNGEALSEEDLVGKVCKAHLSNGSIKEGRIQSVSVLELILAEIESSSAMEEVVSEYFTIAKRDIHELEIRWAAGDKTGGLVLALGIAGYLIYSLFAGLAEFGSMH